MTSNSKKRKWRAGGPSAQAKPGAPGTFRMLVAANPGTSTTVAPELDLVKAALLYGDQVTLISPVTTMLLRVEALERFSPSNQIELIRRVAPVLLPADQVTEFENGIAQVDDFVRTSARGGSAGNQLLRAGLLQQFRPIQQEMSQSVRELGHEAGIDQLAKARSKGIVKIESADPGDAMDLLVSCIVSAKLAEIGERQEDPHTDRIVESFVEKLSKHLSSGREYLIFDEPIAHLVEAAVREGLFSPANGPTGRSAQAMAASALMGRLPTFPDATVDEVLDIRADLSSSLTQFRSAMVTISKTSTTAPWESDFEDALNDAWVESVHPAIEAIDEAVRSNKSLLALAAGASEAAKTSYSGLTIVAAGLLGHVGAVAALGGGIAGASSLLQALRERRATAIDIRMKPFYFLHAIEHSLPQRLSD